MAWAGAETTVGSLMRDFIAILAGEERDVTADLVSPNRLTPLVRKRSLPQVRTIGDIGSYYLPYVPMIINRWPGVRFPCLRRDRAEVIASFTVKLTHPTSARPRNHWSPQSDKRWRRDLIWDRCFPTFDSMLEQGLEAHIARYYDMYYETAEALSAQYPSQLRIFEMSELNSLEGRERLLTFCLPNQKHVDLTVHSNAGPQTFVSPGQD